MRRHLRLLFILLASASSAASGQGYEFKGDFPTPEASRKSLDDTDFRAR